MILPRTATDIAVDLALRRKRAARDFSTYAELVVRDNYLRPIEQGWLHRSWQGHISWCWAHGLHPIVIAPWGTGKTVQLSVEFPVWVIGRRRTLRVCVISNVDENAKKRVAAAHQRIGERPETRLVFPDLRLVGGKPGKHFFSVQGGGSQVDPNYQAHGVLAAGIGNRSDLLVNDDVVDQTNAILEPGSRAKVIDVMDTVWYSRLEPFCSDCQATGVVGGLEAIRRGEDEGCRTCAGTGGGRSISVGTVWHRDDFWHNRMETRGFCVLLQKVDSTRTGYLTEVYGVPTGVTYPTLEQLCTLASPEPERPLLVEALGEDQHRRLQLQSRRMGG